MNRAPESVKFELDYLGPLLADTRALLDGISSISDLLLGQAAPILALIPAVLVSGQTDELETITNGCAEAMVQLRDLQRSVGAIGELLGGRVQALHYELAGDEQEPSS